MEIFIIMFKFWETALIFLIQKKNVHFLVDNAAKRNIKEIPATQVSYLGQ